MNFLLTKVFYITVSLWLKLNIKLVLKLYEIGSRNKFLMLTSSIRRFIRFIAYMLINCNRFKKQAINTV